MRRSSAQAAIIPIVNRLYGASLDDLAREPE